MCLPSSFALFRPLLTLFQKSPSTSQFLALHYLHVTQVNIIHYNPLFTYYSTFLYHFVTIFLQHTVPTLEPLHLQSFFHYHYIIFFYAYLYLYSCFQSSTLCLSLLSHSISTTSSAPTPTILGCPLLEPRPSHLHSEYNISSRSLSLLRFYTLPYISQLTTTLYLYIFYKIPDIYKFDSFFTPNHIYSHIFSTMTSSCYYLSILYHTIPSIHFTQLDHLFSGLTMYTILTSVYLLQLVDPLYKRYILILLPGLASL